MLELAQRVNWDEYILLLSQSNPPVSLQLLAINALLVACWLVRRTRKRKSPSGSAWILVLLFVAGNIGVVNWGGRLTF